MNKLTIAISALLLVSQGCASRANSIAASYVPSGQYQAMNCSRLVIAHKNAQKKANTLAKKQNQTATLDTVTTLFILVPVASAVGADKEGDLATAKGRVLAIEDALASKGC